jgi:hypothetical protein
MQIQIYIGPLAAVDVTSALTGMDLKKVRSAELLDAATAFNGNLKSAASVLGIQKTTKMPSQNNKQTLEALASSGITLLWTAFECLCSDIWVDSVNAHATKLAHRIAKSSGDRNQGGKQISIDKLAKYGFEIKHVMGTILSDRYDLGNLEQASEAYQTAFEEKDRLKSIFELRQLKELQAARNCIVHNAGISDEKYRKVFQGQRPGSKIELNSNIINDYVESVVKCGIELISVVDEWIESHRGPGPVWHLTAMVTNGAGEKLLKDGASVHVAIINNAIQNEPPTVQLLTHDYAALISGSMPIEINGDVINFFKSKYKLLSLKTFESQREFVLWNKKMCITG